MQDAADRFCCALGGGRTFNCLWFMCFGKVEKISGSKIHEDWTNSGTAIRHCEP